MAQILHAPLSEAIFSRIKGNAPREVKETAFKWTNIYHAPPKSFGRAWTQTITVTEVSLDPNPLSDRQTLTVTSEIDVTEGMLDGQGRVSNALIITIIDECVGAAVTTLDYFQGGPNMSGVSLGLDTAFHNSANRGAKLRFVSTTLAGMSCSCKVWDLTRRRLVASANYVGMPSSVPARPRL
ncbi:hypothetical protein K438DRAFT_1816352 [Mycena galopus ATCC 62051]|nr:hypothetical protein K438DRAFT_1816352 [Mycena galopus ATCC 62051]